MTTHRVVVYGIASGPGRRVGRRVRIDDEEVGVAVDLADLLLLLEEHDVYELDHVEWRDGGPDDWAGSAP